MPCTFTIEFEPDRSWKPIHRRLRGLAAALIEPDDNPDHYQQEQPFTVGIDQRRSSPELLVVRLNWLGDDLHEPVSRIADRVSHTHRLGSTKLRCVDWTLSAQTYEELFNGLLRQMADLDFVTPTAFKRRGVSLPLPDPVQVMQSLIRTWTATAPKAVAIDPAAIAKLQGGLAIVRHNVQTRRVEDGPGGQPFVGFEGRVKLALVGEAADDHTALTMFGALTAYATYAGVGRGTTYGFGMVNDRDVADLTNG